jgi:hypothetical protein
MAAAGAATVLVSLSAGSAGAAQTPQANTPVRGCTGGDVCLYDSQAAYRNSQPSVTDTDVPGVLPRALLHLAAAVNNDKTYYSSEGLAELQMLPKGGYICVYLPDSMDEQSPRTSEDPADNASINATAVGTKAVDSKMFLPMSDCQN